MPISKTLSTPRDFRTLLAGMAQIVSERPDTQLLIVGDGPLRPQVETLIEQYQLHQHAQLLGLMHDVGQVLAASDIALLITASWKGLPLAALEAMAMGLPLIISDVGGNREAVLDSETGYVIAPRDVSALVRSVLAVQSRIQNQKHRLHLLGFQPDIAAELDALDALVVASTTETGPLVLMQALACGVPVVSTP